MGRGADGSDVMAKIGTRQRLALEWLVGNPWTTVWWCRRPHTGWPKEMSSSTFDKLYAKRWISIVHIGDRFDKTVAVTAMGIKAISASREV